MDIKGVLLQWFINFLIKKTSVGAVKKDIIQNEELAEQFTQTNYYKIWKKKKVHSSFIDNIWGTDLADMQLIS